MKENNKRRSFLRNIAIGSMSAVIAPTTLIEAKEAEPCGESNCIETVNTPDKNPLKRKYNAAYTGENLHRVAFSIGGIGACMC